MGMVYYILLTFDIPDIRFELYEEVYLANILLGMFVKGRFQGTCEGFITPEQCELTTF